MGGDQVQEKYGVTVNHTKLDDTANAVSAVVAAKAAGVNEGGEIDLIWINGENFRKHEETGPVAGGRLGSKTAKLAVCRLEEQADNPDGFYRTYGRTGGALGHGKNGILS